jgi:hypothetical protein
MHSEPAGQVVQFDEPSKANVPLEHGVHSLGLAPKIDAVPAGQMEGSPANDRHSDPAGQGVQPVAPAAMLNEPAAQSMHADTLVALRATPNFPAGHASMGLQPPGQLKQKPNENKKQGARGEHSGQSTRAHPG